MFNVEEKAWCLDTQKAEGQDDSRFLAFSFIHLPLVVRSIKKVEASTEEHQEHLTREKTILFTDKSQHHLRKGQLRIGKKNLNPGKVLCKMCNLLFPLPMTLNGSLNFYFFLCSSHTHQFREDIEGRICFNHYYSDIFFIKFLLTMSHMYIKDSDDFPVLFLMSFHLYRIPPHHPFPRLISLIEFITCFV